MGTRPTLDRTVRYVQCGDGQVAYSAFGSGPLELLLIDDWAWHLEAAWDDPDTAAEYERLASFARVVMWNRRGVGLSDPLPPDQLTTIDNGLDGGGPFTGAASCIGQNVAREGAS